MAFLTDNFFERIIFSTLEQIKRETLWQEQFIMDEYRKHGYDTFEKFIKVVFDSDFMKSDEHREIIENAKSRLYKEHRLARWGYLFDPLDYTSCIEKEPDDKRGVRDYLYSRWKQFYPKEE